MNPIATSVNEKKVLIIAYYWPPSGGSGVQRWLKFVKYLPQYNYTPYIFTPANPSFAVQDESLLKDVPPEAQVIHFPIWEPYDAFFKLSRLIGGGKKTVKATDLVSVKKKSMFQKLSTWIRGNVFIPDPRVFWVRPSLKFLERYLKEHNIKTIITTGPPHSLHLIGYALKKKDASLNWIADFRDPWSEWGFLESIMVGKSARKKHKQLEAKVLASADKVVTITPFYVRQFESLGKRKVNLLTNGFDEDDFNAIVYKKSAKFLIRHIGIVNEKCNPRPFMEAVKILLHEHADFKKNVSIEFIGEVNTQFKQYINQSPELTAIIEFTGNVSHKTLISRYGESSLLLLILTGYKDAEGYMPGKLFEYLATGLPIMAVGPTHGDSANLLAETQAGNMVDSDDIDGMKKVLLSNFEAWKASESPIVKKVNALRYSRRMITSELTKLF